MKTITISAVLCMFSCFLSAQSIFFNSNSDQQTMQRSFMKNGEDKTQLTLVSDIIGAKQMEEVSKEDLKNSKFFSFDLDQCLTRHKLVVDKMRSLQKSFGDFLDLFDAKPLWDSNSEVDWNRHLLSHSGQGNR
ncbi:hypothetical protein [Aegicerativicinus sediminis]|uniref:hypothetical protein n=1 Tax=Aegicerativicinus sediminis TaxID=2893202 RepID=UPI001E4AE4FB|nr:hypothetical protein [Aegicerativicinus sediminis]